MHIIQRSILILFATVSFLGMGIVGFVPNGLDPITGLFLGSTMALILLRSVIEEYLDELQRWVMFASFGTLYFAIGIFYTWTREGSLSGELIIGYIACIMVSSLFGYRAIKRGTDTQNCRTEYHMDVRIVSVGTIATGQSSCLSRFHEYDSATELSLRKSHRIATVGEVSRTIRQFSWPRDACPADPIRSSVRRTDREQC